MTQVSIKDVAARAGVSTATVSRILNKVDYPISPEARLRVERAIRELHYVPNRSAKALRTRAGNGIALLVRDIGHSYFTEIARGATETALKRDCLSMIFNSMQDASYELKYYDLILRQQFDGVIAVGGGYSDPDSQKGLRGVFQEMKRQGVRAVALAPQGFEVPTIMVDNRLLGEQIADYVLARGHRRVAYIGGYVNHLADEERLRGFRDAHRKHGVKPDERMILRRDFSWKGGYECCGRLLELARAPTAVCCSNDNIAVGVVNRLKESGRSIPGDVSIISIGGFANQLPETPRLTAMRLPFYEMGRKAVEYLLSNSDLEGLHLVLESTLCEGGSVRAL